MAKRAFRDPAFSVWGAKPFAFRETHSEKQTQQSTCRAWPANRFQAHGRQWVSNPKISTSGPPSPDHVHPGILTLARPFSFRLRQTRNWAQFASGLLTVTMFAKCVNTHRAQDAYIYRILPPTPKPIRASPTLSLSLPDRVSDSIVSDKLFY